MPVEVPHSTSRSKIRHSQRAVGGGIQGEGRVMVGVGVGGISGGGIAVSSPIKGGSGRGAIGIVGTTAATGGGGGRFPTQKTEMSVVGSDPHGQRGRTDGGVD
jgi:hypothetical protein